MADRIYSESEIADLIARAAQRQRGVDERSTQAGLTLSEIEQVGRETGIDPAHLRAAAAEMDASPVRWDAGEPTTHVGAERWVDAPLTMAGWETVVGRVQAGLGLSAMDGGTIRQIGDAFEWRSTNGMGAQVTVLASPRGDRTRLRISRFVGVASPQAEGRVRGGAIAITLAILAGLALLGGTDASAWAVALAGLVTLAAVWAVAQPAITRRRTRARVRQQHRVDQLADGLRDALASSVGETPPLGSESDPARLDLGLLDVDATEAGDVTSPLRVRE